MNDNQPSNEAQRRLFFALVSDLGHDSEEAKERAKKAFGVEHFTDLTSQQISTLIDKMQNTLAFKDSPLEPEQKPKEETPSTNSFIYKFTISIFASAIEPMKKVFDELNEGASSILGQELKIDAKLPITTMTMTTDKEMTKEQLDHVAEIIQTDIKERTKLGIVEVKLER